MGRDFEEAAMRFGDEFVGKRVVITGAAGIYGGWIAAAFAKAGAIQPP